MGIVGDLTAELLQAWVKDAVPWVQLGFDHDWVYPPMTGQTPEIGLPTKHMRVQGDVYCFRVLVFCRVAIREFANSASWPFLVQPPWRLRVQSERCMR